MSNVFIIVNLSIYLLGFICNKIFKTLIHNINQTFNYHSYLDLHINIIQINRFISSFILFLLIYYLLFLQDLLYIFTILLFYLLFNINIIIQLLIFSTSALFINLYSISFLLKCEQHLPFILIDLYNMKHYSLFLILLYLLLSFLI